MRTIRIIEHISLDGVIQAPGGRDEDRDGGFRHGGWIVPHSDPVVGGAIMGAHAGRFDLLLGRGTYDIWADYWPKVRGSSFADSFNAATKYVVTHRPESLSWGPVEAIGAGGEDVLERLRRIKAGGEGDRGGGSVDGIGGEKGERRDVDMIVWGSSTITPLLLGHGLADEVVLLVYPVLLGTGKRFFSEGGGVEARELALVSTKAAASGVLINTYRPVGALRTGTIAKAPA